jgi:predicted GIY-YIG superfamily endonuclease
MWFVYVIYSGNNTYIGSTNNLKRRLRQHNGEIVGGAKATKKATDWQYLAYITGFKDHINCLSCEWRLKHPTGKRNSSCHGINGKIKALNTILLLDKWSSKCTIDNKECEYTLSILEEYLDKIDKFEDNVKVLSLPICEV